MTGAVSHYLDSAATTLQKPKNVAEAMKKAVGTLSSPGRGGHAAAMAAAEKAYECRTKAAELFSVSNPENVVLTTSATHGLNIAIKTLAKKGSRVVISGYEHNSVTRPLHAIGAVVSVASSELFSPEQTVQAFKNKITRDTDLVVLNHVSNVFGNIQPAEQIGEICQDIGVPFILDASQSAGVINIDFTSVGADFIAMPGHKGLYGPQGTGILLCGSLAKPIFQGGTGSSSISREMPGFLPDALEAGTHNMPGIAGLYEGLDFVLKKTPEELMRHERRLIELAVKKLSEIDGVRVFSADDFRNQAGVLSFIIDRMSCEAAAEALGNHSIAVRAGLHCAPLAHETVGTLKTGTIRVSTSAFTKTRDINALCDAVKTIALAR